MDHTFKNKPYTTSVVVTLVFSAIIAMCFTDNSSCPMIWQLIVEGYDAKMQLCNITKYSNATCISGTHCAPFFCAASESEKFSRHPLSALVPTSVFSPMFHYSPCNMVDLLLHVYIIAFIVFFVAKWLLYKIAGWHYFLIDYCYFHNFVFIGYLLLVLLRVDVNIDYAAAHGQDINGMYKPQNDLNSKEGDGYPEGNIVVNAAEGSRGKNEWKSAVAAAALTDGSARSDKYIPNRGLFAGLVAVCRSVASSEGKQQFAYYGVDVILRGIIVPQIRQAEILYRSARRRFSLHNKNKTDTNGNRSPLFAQKLDSTLYRYSTFRNEEAVEGESKNNTQFMITSPLPLRTDVIVQPLREALFDLSSTEQEAVVALFVVFLSGSLGPIAWSIVGWKNALLFQSFDKMSSCFLHLLPGIVQIAMMDSIVTSLFMESFSIDWLARTALTGGAIGISGNALKAKVEGAVRRTVEMLPSWAMKRSFVNKVTNKLLVIAATSARQTQPNSSNRSILETLVSNIESSGPAVGGLSRDLYDLFIKYTTFFNWIWSHLAFFLLWQLFYHTIFESMNFRREMMYKVKLSSKSLRRKIILKLTLRDKRRLEGHRDADGTADDGGGANSSDDAGSPNAPPGSPTFRVNAYSWMMEKPPLGKSGPLYRMVVMFGQGPIRTKFMFSVVQGLTHVFFCTAAYVPIWLTRVGVHLVMSGDAHDGLRTVQERVRRGRFVILALGLYWACFLVVAIWNSAVIMKKWINRLYGAIEPKKGSKMDLEATQEEMRHSQKQ